MTRRLLNDDPRCERKDNCRATGELCLECAMAAGIYRDAARKGSADPAAAARTSEVQRRCWADPQHRSYRLSCMARARVERASKAARKQRQNVRSVSVAP